jgi:hypothetical protein
MRGLSAAQIAAHFGVAKAVILARLHEIGIRSQGDSRRSTNPTNYRCPNAPYGFAVKQGRLVPNKSELRTCRLIVEAIRGGQSANSVCRNLMERGIKARSGKVKWGHFTVLSIFNRWKDKL